MGSLGTPLYSINEVQAYDAELIYASSLGLTAEQTQFILDYRFTWWSELGPLHQSVVDQGVYTLP